MVKQKSEAIRTSISFANKGLFDLAQNNARDLYLGNLSMYLQKLILEDSERRGISTAKIVNP